MLSFVQRDCVRRLQSNWAELDWTERNWTELNWTGLD